MNKKDLIPVIALALLIPLWMYVDRTFIAPKYPAKTPVAAEQPAEPPATSETAAAPRETTLVDQAEEIVLEVAVPPVDETLVVIENEKIQLQLTSIGGGIKTATLIATDPKGKIRYPELNEDESPPVVLNFTNSPALVYEGIAGMGASDAFNLMVSDDGKQAVITKELNDMVFERTITLGDGYLLDISDRFIASASQPDALPAFRILTGHMQNPADMKAQKGISLLGVDSFTPAGEINYWGRKLNKLFKLADKPETLDTVPQDMNGVEVDWVAAKNKFFTQILRADEPIATMAILSSRDLDAKGTVPRDIAAALSFKTMPIAAGDALTLDYTYYIGPKQYSILKAAGNSMEGVMEFETIGVFSWMNWLMEPSRKALLWTLNLFHGIFRNYGIAIILLTLVIRILFWPLTHKSTESMRRMQELQPEIKALQAKHKKDPQRMQQETMKLYKEKKVNPMGGCLPMFVQIPVFIALFTVLRNAIELRYAGFLWIADLSAPENLLMGKVPFVGSLNILPIVMSASMIWQQKMTSPAAAATPEQQQQQKMMMIMMPLMMLFFFYSMPSGLVLYWTTSNLLMIAQTSIRNLRRKVTEA
jgi:YidC/Oxa1 family membrane protein insertase